MNNAATYAGSGDFVSPEHAASCPAFGPTHNVLIAIAGAPYSGAHTRRAIRSAMTRARVTECTINGLAYNAAGLAYRHDLA